jgi:hypothetical protein
MRVEVGLGSAQALLRQAGVVRHSRIERATARWGLLAREVYRESAH